MNKWDICAYKSMGKLKFGYYQKFVMDGIIVADFENVALEQFVQDDEVIEVLMATGFAENGTVVAQVADPTVTTYLELIVKTNVHTVLIETQTGEQETFKVKF